MTALEDFLIGEVAACTATKLDPLKAKDFVIYALNALPALRIILERSGPAGAAPFCDFHEFATASDNVRERKKPHFNAIGSFEPRFIPIGFSYPHSTSIGFSHLHFNSIGFPTFTLILLALLSSSSCYR